MLKNDDTSELLKYFLPKYTTSTVRIDPQNNPHVTRANDTNFEDMLNELMLKRNLQLAFGQTKFLYTEVKGDVFVTSFRCRIRVYEDDEEIYTSSLITQLAGEDKDGWKVGNYNWVTVNYE